MQREIGLRYTHDTSTEGEHVMKVDQTAYIDAMIERFDLTDPSFPSPKTPLPERVYEDEELREWSQKFSYPMLIGSLIHALVHTRPDIAYPVSVLSRAMSYPTSHHYKTARRLLLYLRTTRELGIEYHQKNMLENERLVTSAVEEHGQYLEASVDASFADDQETCRSTSGYVV